MAIKLPLGNPKETEETEEAKAARLAAESVEETAEEKLAREQAEAAAEQAKLDEAEVARLAALESTDDNTIIVEDEKGVKVTYILDASGNAVDDKGTVIYTAADIAGFTSDIEEPITLSVADVSAISGIKLLDDKGAERVYDNSIEGLAQREVDIKEAFFNEGVNKALVTFFESHPNLKAQYEYERTYGTLEGFSSYVDYSTITIDKDNESTQIDLIVKAELAKGTSAERAMRIANFSKAEGTLYADSQDSLKFLQDSQTKDRTAADARELADANAEIEKSNKFYGITYNDKNEEVVLDVEGSIYDMVVSKGKVGNIFIPKDGLTVKQPDGTGKHFNRRQIFDYIHKPISEIDGEYYSQAQIDEYKRLTSKDELVASYIRNLLGGDVSQLVEISKRKGDADTVRRHVFRVNSTSNTNNQKGGAKVVIPVNRKN